LRRPLLWGLFLFFEFSLYWRGSAARCEENIRLLLVFSDMLFLFSLMDHRSQKKIVFGAIYSALLLGVAYLVYLPFRPPETCVDGKKNQNETGIDCGGVCSACVVAPILEDIRVIESAWVSGGRGNIYDVVGKISNPNNDYGASSVPYTFRILDTSGGTLLEKSGESFVLPQEEKYIVETSVSLSGEPARVEMVLGEIGWEKFSDYREKPALDVYNKRFEEISSGIGFGEAKGLVVNNSPFDFIDLGIVVVLRDGGNRVVALQKTDMQTLRSGEQRDFTLKWPDPFSGDVKRVEVQTDANVYRTSTFIRQYLPTMTESFQKLDQ
jgi:hypothetical protein